MATLPHEALISRRHEHQSCGPNQIEQGLFPLDPRLAYHLGPPWYHWQSS